jgi:hypothetical protein
LLVQDHDDGNCPLIANIECGARRRKARNALPRAPATSKNKVRDPKPELRKTRSYLGAKKREQKA